MKTYTYKTQWGDTYEIALTRSKYTSNNTLAVIMYLVENGKIVEQFDMLTTNIDDSDEMGSDKRAFVDTNNGMKDIDKWLIENKIAKPLFYYGFSGFCTYPLFEFDIDSIEEE